MVHQDLEFWPLSLLYLTSKRSSFDFVSFVLDSSSAPGHVLFQKWFCCHLRQTHTGEPSGGIVSNAQDMAKWLQFHLNDGRGGSDGDPLLPDWVLHHIYTPNMYSGGGWTRPRYPVSNLRLFYGMGWRTALYRGENNRHWLFYSGS